MKKVIIFFCLFSFFWPLAVQAGMEPGEIVANQEENLNLAELEKFITEIESDLHLLFPDFSWRQILEKFKKGELDFAPHEILTKALAFFWREVIFNLSILGKILVIAVLGAILQTLQTAFTKGTVARLAYFICFAALITLTVGSFKIALDTGWLAINKMAALMKILLPLLLVLLTTLGGLTTTALLQPFLLVFFGFLVSFTQNIIFPAIFLTAILCITNNLSDHFKLSRLVSFAKQMTKAAIGLVLTLFVGIISAEGVLGAVVDGVTLRTAKYMAGTFVPVAGSMFADALDAVMGGSLLLKNALGLTGVLLLGAILLFPICKVLALAIIYRLAAALIQPLGDTLLADTLEEMAGCLFLTFAAVAAVAIMFFAAITVIVGAANLTIMFR